MSQIWKSLSYLITIYLLFICQNNSQVNDKVNRWFELFWYFELFKFLYLSIAWYISLYRCLRLCVVVYVLAALLVIPPAQFKLVLDSIIWGFKHTMRNVADTGLGVLYQMLQNVAQSDVAAQSFYQTYYTDILQHIFSVVTDSSHSAGLSLWLGLC